MNAFPYQTSPMKAMETLKGLRPNLISFMPEKRYFEIFLRHFEREIQIFLYFELYNNNLCTTTFFKAHSFIHSITYFVTDCCLMLTRHRISIYINEIIDILMFELVNSFTSKLNLFVFFVRIGCNKRGLGTCKKR